MQRVLASASEATETIIVMTIGDLAPNSTDMIVDTIAAGTDMMTTV
jgi:hypothetical protein